MEITGSLIAAILYNLGRKKWIKFNDPVYTAIDKTIQHFHKKDIEIEIGPFTALLEGNIGQGEIERFRKGEGFIDGDELARQFAILGDFYLGDEKTALKVAKEVFSYFNNALISELLKDPRSTIQTLYSVMSIGINLSQSGQQRILKEFQNLRKFLEKEGRLRGLEMRAVWPGISFPDSGPKVSVPFAGREDELKELSAGMGGNKNIIAVVGLAGQGKSCLAGEWYKRGARPAEGTGLFWRKLYEPGYTFDIFLDDFYFYLTGEHINRQEITSASARSGMVQDALRQQPCWIVLDGAERWLKRWSAEPDAQIEKPTVDDREAVEEAFDKFIKHACFWDNGSKVLLTTRAIPSALDENPPVMIGQKHGRQTLLVDLKPQEAVALLKELGVSGDDAIMLKAVKAYGCHPYAVHVLGVLLHDLYDADISRWKEVNPLEETKIAGLFERIIEHRQEDIGLLSLVACSMRSVPVEMLVELLGLDEGTIRKAIAELIKWQMVEFEWGNVKQHIAIKQYLIERMGQERARELHTAIEDWWDQQEATATPLRIYIDMTEYDEEDVVELIELLSDLYESMTGDRLVIESKGMIEPSLALEPVDV